MSSHPANLGIMKPIGGGDPIPLLKVELVIGRRPTCDIQLDYENISGKHCILKFYNQVWHVKDLGSTNGTTINGAPLSSEHTVMPDDELGIAHRAFSIDYEPGAPESIINKHKVLEDDIVETRKKTSLMELAGLDTDGDRKKRTRPTKAPEVIERLSVDEAEFEDNLPQHVKAAPKPVIETSDDDFFNLINESVNEKPDKK